MTTAGPGRWRRLSATSRRIRRISGRRHGRSTAPIFAALGDETRLRLVTRLSAEGPLSIANLTEGTDVTRQAVSKHLEVLAQAGLAHSSQHGRERIWELEQQPLLTAHDFLQHISQQWDEALAKLAEFVERP